MNCPQCKRRMVGYAGKLYRCTLHGWADYDEIKAMREAIKAKRRKKA